MSILLLLSDSLLLRLLSLLLRLLSWLLRHHFGLLLLLHDSWRRRCCIGRTAGPHRTDDLRLECGSSHWLMLLLLLLLRWLSLVNDGQLLSVGEQLLLLLEQVELLQGVETHLLRM